ncbi:OsmC family protein [Parendozoicomonas sp. Alg238-R29]|uniref:OsmC family protein n=1 Tax=Parendozoicomonas sp. Alg238-R29 TaxID=2993446 RepID=UPI00248D4A7E|nr:OsmC family protein [Parendozoicomonas sp. Alg238-R29]
MKAQVKWIDGMRFAGMSGSGHSIMMDTSSKHGGSESAPSPMEMILMAVGGCSSVDVVSTLKKSRQDVIDCEVQLDSERVDAVPAIFSKIHLHFVVTGRGLKEAVVRRAVELSADKYCSASIMLGKAGVEITHDFEIVEL